ncbi:MAG: hypothetical protein ABIH83_03125 [Candidatus Micrarchaeota archaeon]
MILTLVKSKRASPAALTEEDELERLCRSIRLVSRRDLDGTVTTVIRTMLEESADSPIGSSELAGLARLNRITVMHHLKRLENAGIVQRKQHKYLILPSGFSEIVRRMRGEMDMMMNEAEVLAERIDDEYFPPMPKRPRRRIIAVEGGDSEKKKEKN